MVQFNIFLICRIALQLSKNETIFATYSFWAIIKNS